MNKHEPSDWLLTQDQSVFRMNKNSVSSTIFLSLNQLTGFSLLPSAHNSEQGDKQDIYQFGLILLEVITGKPTDSQSELESLKAQVHLKFHFTSQQ